jgi:hypothetical protein
MLACAHVVPSRGATGCLNRSGKRDVREDSTTRARGVAMRQGRSARPSRDRDGSALCGYPHQRHHDRQGNIPPCKALKTHEMRKESRFCASSFLRVADLPAPTRGGPAPRRSHGRRAIADVIALGGRIDRGSVAEKGAQYLEIARCKTEIAGRPARRRRLHRAAPGLLRRKGSSQCRPGRLMPQLLGIRSLIPPIDVARTFG